MSAFEELSAWVTRLPEMRLEDQQRRERAVRQLTVMGVPAVLRSDGAITVSTSGFADLRSLATYPEPRSVVSSIFGIPLYRAADWTFEPASVAEARLAARVLRPFKRVIRGLLALSASADERSGS